MVEEFNPQKELDTLRQHLSKCADDYWWDDHVVDEDDVWEAANAFVRLDAWLSTIIEATTGFPQSERCPHYEDYNSRIQCQNH